MNVEGAEEGNCPLQRNCGADPVKVDLMSDCPARMSHLTLKLSVGEMRIIELCRHINASK